MSHSDSIRVGRTHHHAFDDRLPAHEDFFRRRCGFLIRHQISQELDFFSPLPMPYRFWKRSIRPAVSTNFCFPVKNGWQEEHNSNLISDLVERVSNLFPQAQVTVTLWYLG